MPAPKIKWTDDLRNKVKELWREGKSSPEIASILGREFTKNMVLGQLYAMGEMRSGKASNGASPRQPKPRPKTYAKREKDPNKPPQANDVWGADDETRRRRFTQKAAAGARAQLAALEAMNAQ